MEGKTMPRIKFLLFALALAVQLPIASATVTAVVGTCEEAPFTTITEALRATPPPNVIKICPGTYPEQIEITFPVTLEGISDGTSTGATISVPSGGFVVNATNDFGESMAVQVLVENAGGDVNLSNLTVDGSGATGECGHGCEGIFYQNSPGTMDHLTMLNPAYAGVWLEGGSANPSVTLENSNLQGSGVFGVYAETNSSSSELTAAIKGNDLTVSEGAFGIFVANGTTVSVSGNLVVSGDFGISIESGGSVSKNTVVGVGFRGIETEGGSVTSNVVFNSAISAEPPPSSIWVNSSTATVTGNSIVQSGNAIDFYCIAGSNVHSNTILGAGNGLIDVPTGTVSKDTYYNIGTISSGGC
jgi:hypothetical protein